MAGYLSKSAGRYGEAVSGRGDRVGDVTGRQKPDGLKDEDPPNNLRALKPVQRQAEIDKNAAERKALNARMAELVKKRDAYMMEQRRNAPAKPADSLDRAVAERSRCRSSAKLAPASPMAQSSAGVKAGGSTS